jgi:hypothetical protein
MLAGLGLQAIAAGLAVNQKLLKLNLANNAIDCVSGACENGMCLAPSAACLLVCLNLLFCILGAKTDPGALGHQLITHFVTA